jgi:hypothetical protein
MVPRQLFVLGPAASRPPGHGIEALTSNALNEVSDCVALNTALFGTTDGATFRFASDGTWEFSRQKEFPAGVGTLMVGGTWDGAAGSGTVTHASFRTLNEPGRVVFSSLASDFRTVPVFGSAVAHVMTAEQGGAPYRRVLLESIEPLDEETFRAVTVTPAIDGTDAVRGEVTFTELTDLTGGEPQYVVRGPEGDLQRLSFGETPRGRDSAVLQILGWCVAAALVVLIVLLRVRARST